MFATFIKCRKLLEPIENVPIIQTLKKKINYCLMIGHTQRTSTKYYMVKAVAMRLLLDLPPKKKLNVLCVLSIVCVCAHVDKQPG